MDSDEATSHHRINLTIVMTFLSSAIVSWYTNLSPSPQLNNSQIVMTFLFPNSIYLPNPFRSAIANTLSSFLSFWDIFFPFALLFFFSSGLLGALFCAVVVVRPFKEPSWPLNCQPDLYEEGYEGGGKRNKKGENYLSSSSAAPSDRE